MIHVKVRIIGGETVIVLDDAARVLLGVQDGDILGLESTEAGVVVTGDDAVTRGKLFVERYIKTFEALAK